MVSNWIVVCPNTEGVKLQELTKVTRDSLGGLQSHLSLGSILLRGCLFLIICQLYKDRTTQLAQDNNKAGEAMFYCNTVLYPRGGLE